MRQFVPFKDKSKEMNQNSPQRSTADFIDEPTDVVRTFDPASRDC